MFGSWSLVGADEVAAGSLFLRYLRSLYLGQRQVVLYVYLDRATDHAPTWEELAQEFGGGGTV